MDAISGAATAPPPDSNTGGRVTFAVSVDWVQGIVKDEYLTPLIQVVSAVAGEGKERGTSLNGYTRSIVWESGARVYWGSERGDVWLVVPGATCARMRWTADLRAFLDLLADAGFRCTRLDLACDDYSRELIKMDVVHASVRNVTRYKTASPRRDVNPLTGELRSDSVYFGARGKNGSGKYVRFYDKRLESDGLVDCNRLEIEFSAEHAACVFENLVDAASDAHLAAKIGRAIAGAIEFRERRAEAHGHLDRMPLLAWWESLVGLLGAAVVKVKRVKPPLQKTAEYFLRCWPKTLALMVSVGLAGGHDVMQFLVDRITGKIKAAERWRPGAELDFAALLGIPPEREAWA